LCRRVDLHLKQPYAEARGLEVVEEFVDHGVSGAKDRRPALDRLLADAKRRKFDVLVVTKLDRLARSVRHLTTLAAEFEALGIGLVVLDQAIDTTTPNLSGVTVTPLSYAFSDGVQTITAAVHTSFTSISTDSSGNLFEWSIELSDPTPGTLFPGIFTYGDAPNPTGEVSADLATTVPFPVPNGHLATTSTVLASGRFSPSPRPPR
jgi:hypothetical protein